MSPRSRCVVVLSTLALAGAVVAQPPPAGPPAAPPEASARTAVEPPARRLRTPPINLKLQLVVSQYQGERKIASLPYTLALPADGLVKRLHMGVRVPLRGTQADGAVQYHNLGTSIDCRADPATQERFVVGCLIEQSSAYVEADRAASAPPPDAADRPTPFRSFRVDTALVLGDGQTAEYTSATDPVSGEVLKVELTLQVLN